MQGVFDVGGTGYRTAKVIDNYRLSVFRYGSTDKDYKMGILKLKKDLEYPGAKDKLDKIVGCIAGKFNEAKSRLVFSPNLPNWVNKPIKEDLEKELGCEVILENDAVAEGLGEAVFGAGKNFTKILYFTAGTGIGGSLITTKTPKNLVVKNLEPGWTIKVEGKFLEELAGGKSIGNITLVDWQKEADLLAKGVNKLIKKYKPEAVVTGGSLFKSVDWDYFKNKVDGLAIKSKLGQTAGLWGCIELLRENQRQN